MNWRDDDIISPSYLDVDDYEEREMVDADGSAERWDLRREMERDDEPAWTRRRT